MEAQEQLQKQLDVGTSTEVDTEIAGTQVFATGRGKDPLETIERVAAELARQRREMGDVKIILVATVVVLLVMVATLVIMVLQEWTNSNAEVQLRLDCLNGTQNYADCTSNRLLVQ